MDLISKLLVKVPEKRLGSNQEEGLMFSDLKAHPYFKDINFETLFDQEIPEIKEDEFMKTQFEVKGEKLKKQIEDDIEDLFGEKEKIIMSGIVEKKTFASYTMSFMVLL